jgi:microsomal dipeptidase-like Zn-dependent dipeptidase
LTDDQVRALVEHGGVVQATFYDGFLVESGEATIDDAVRHIMHLIDVAGIDNVGIGSDFDGDGGVRGLRTAADMLSLTRRLMAEGLNERSLRKLWGGNFVRVMSRVQYNTLLNGGYVDQ